MRKPNFIQIDLNNPLSDGFKGERKAWYGHEDGSLGLKNARGEGE
jgi:hypothetical protein